MELSPMENSGNLADYVNLILSRKAKVLIADHLGLLFGVLDMLFHAATAGQDLCFP